MKLFEKLQPLRHASWNDAVVLLGSGFAALFFIVTSFDSAIYLKTCSSGLILLSAVFLSVFVVWLVLIAASPAKEALSRARISMSPFAIYLLLIPYNFFYAVPGGIHPAIPLVMVPAAVFVFFKVLSKPYYERGGDRLPLKWMILMACGYAAVFGLIAVLRHINFQDTSSFDTALYNQIQWNNIHGRFYQSSISGSNFVTHNSPFLILISPFYALYPHPGTLLIIKSFVLALSVIPFYFLLKRLSVPSPAQVPLSIAYLFYPFIIGQQFNAPHEMCFLPPFLLLTLYFFLESRLGLFFVFLLLSLSVKEHMALVAVMFGLYSVVLKRGRLWIYISVAAGVLWAGFSLWIMHHFQQIYTVDPYPAWLIDNISERFLRPGYPAAENIFWGVKTSVAGHGHSLIFIYTLFACVGLIFPFLSVITLLGLPELLINLAASIPLFYPAWHYNIVSGCFIMAGCSAAIGRLRAPPSSGLTAGKFRELCAWFICFCVLSHSFLWIDFLRIPRDPVYLADMKEAIALIPDDASVSAPKHLVSHISTRDRYYLLQDTRKGDYILVDHDRTVDNPVMSEKGAVFYDEIFEKDGVRLYKKRDMKGR